MGLFSGITDMFGGGGGSAPQFNPQTAKLDPEMLAQYQADIGGVRDMANNPITGLSAGGLAGQNLAQSIYSGQLQNQQGQQASQLASAQAGLGRYGADSGSAERMQGQMARQGLIGEQQLGMAGAQNQANIGYQDIQQQQANQYNALMALPSLSAQPLQMQNQMNQFNTGIQNDAQLANMASQQAQNDRFGGMLGSIGGLAGSYFGGPIGSGLGELTGNMASGLFSKG